MSNCLQKIYIMSFCHIFQTSIFIVIFIALKFQINLYCYTIKVGNKANYLFLLILKSLKNFFVMNWNANKTIKTSLNNSDKMCRSRLLFYQYFENYNWYFDLYIFVWHFIDTVWNILIVHATYVWIWSTLYLRPYNSPTQEIYRNQINKKNNYCSGE